MNEVIEHIHWINHGVALGYLIACYLFFFALAEGIQYAEIRTRVRRLNQAGDSGSMRVRYDDAVVNGQPYDTFDNGFGLNKWQIFAGE